MTSAEWIQKIIAFYDASWSVSIIVYGSIWSFKVVRRIFHSAL